jgi:hypothetical protein
MDITARDLGARKKRARPQPSAFTPFLIIQLLKLATQSVNLLSDFRVASFGILAR